MMRKRRLLWPVSIFKARLLQPLPVSNDWKTSAAVKCGGRVQRTAMKTRKATKNKVRTRPSNLGR